MLPNNQNQVHIFGKDDVSRLCKCILATSSKVQSIRSRQRLKFVRKNLVVAILAWLFMNTDPAYPQRVLGSMLASRLIQKSISRPPSYASIMGGRSYDYGYDNHHHGMNTAEAIALIHAMNSNRGDNSVDLSPLLKNGAVGNHARTRQSPLSLVGQRSTALDRQLPTGINRQAGPVGAVAAVAAAVAALAALAAALLAVLAGLAPIAAVAAALAAALAALLAAALIAVLLALVAVVPSAALVKKLVIKKTVLPFVIPIPIKKKEKEIIYIPKPVHYHHKEHHHHVEHKYKKHKKSDNLDDITPHSPPKVSDSHSLDHSDKIQSLLSEQDKIQNIIDEIAVPKNMYGEASTISITKAAKPKLKGA